MKISLKNNISRSLFVGLLLSAISLTTQAEGITDINILSKDDGDQFMLSAGAVLEHNRHLLEHTTIGSSLKSSTNERVKILYQEAKMLFNKASDAHNSGQENMARELAIQSIHRIYSADREYFNLKKLIPKQ